MKFVTLFWVFENIHIIKDVGQIPFHLHEKYGYESVVVTKRKSTSFEFLDKYAKGLKIEFIDGKNKFKCFFKYINKNAKKIDVLNIYHINLKNAFLLWKYKRKNRKGKAFLKGDVDFITCENIDLMSKIKLRLLSFFLKKLIY